VKALYILYVYCMGASIIYVYTIHIRSLSVQALYRRLCLFSRSSRYYCSWITLTTISLTAAKFKLLLFLWNNSSQSRRYITTDYDRPTYIPVCGPWSELRASQEVLVVVGVINLSRFYLWIVLGIVSYISHRLPDRLRLKPPSLLKFLGWILFPFISFIKRIIGLAVV
jgi:hypothetical protein